MPPIRSSPHAPDPLPCAASGSAGGGAVAAKTVSAAFPACGCAADHRPAVADIADFVSQLRAQGWRVEALGNYLELTPTLHPPLCTETPAWRADRVELRRLHSLLERHPEGAATETEILAFLKAEEAGERALETLCRTLCRDCAERLRNHASLPGGLLPYAAGALMKEECLCC